MNKTEPKEITIETLQEFEKLFGDKKFPHLRFGQAACNFFKLAKDIDDQLYYETYAPECRAILWRLAVTKK